MGDWASEPMSKSLIVKALGCDSEAAITCPAVGLALHLKALVRALS
jgi:hypothetical protein